MAGASGYLRSGLAPVANNRPRSRLFFAAFPDARAAQELSRLAYRLREVHGLQGTPLSPERLHVTLHFLGDYHAIPESLIDSARSAAKLVKLLPFKVVFDRVTSFDAGSHRRPVVLVASEGMSKLSELHETLRSARHDLGVGSADADTDRIYVPHLTLLYDSQRLEVSLSDPIEWTVSEFFLIQSLIGQSKYVVLDSRTLFR